MLSLGRWRQPLLIVMLIVPLLGHNPGFSTWRFEKNLKHEQAKDLPCKNCPPTPGPSASHTQHRDQEKIEWMPVSIFFFGAFQTSGLSWGLLALIPSSLSPSNNQTTVFFQFSGSECHCHYWGHLSSWSEPQVEWAAPQAYGTRVSHIANLPVGTLWNLLFYNWNVLAGPDYFGFCDISAMGKCSLASCKVHLSVWT